MANDTTCCLLLSAAAAQAQRRHSAACALDQHWLFNHCTKPLYCMLHCLQILVGNKSDMADEKRAVPYAKGKALADEYKIKFFETSAKDNINVEEVCAIAAAVWVAGMASMKVAALERRFQTAVLLAAHLLGCAQLHQCQGTCHAPHTVCRGDSVTLGHACIERNHTWLTLLLSRLLLPACSLVCAGVYVHCTRRYAAVAARAGRPAECSNFIANQAHVQLGQSKAAQAQRLL